jgi:hypothetical protein
VSNNDQTDERPKSHTFEFSLIGALILVSIVNVIIAHTL